MDEEEVVHQPKDLTDQFDLAEGETIEQIVVGG